MEVHLLVYQAQHTSGIELYGLHQSALCRLQGLVLAELVGRTCYHRERGTELM